MLHPKTAPSKELTGIKIGTAPSKTVYNDGEKFDKTGMVIKATYSDGSEEEVQDYTFEPTRALTTADTKITISYKGKTVEQTITVNKVLSSIAITTPPSKTEYRVGETFDKTAMVVTATYSDESTETVEGYTFEPSGALAVENTEITVTYQGKTAKQSITVTAE